MSHLATHYWTLLILLASLGHACQNAGQPVPEGAGVVGEEADVFLSVVLGMGDSALLAEHYWSRGALYQAGELVQGPANMLDHWRSLPQVGALREYRSLGKTYHDSTHYYEWGHYLDTAGIPRLASLIAWQLRVAGGWRRDLEILHPYQAQSRAIPAAIDRARGDWVRYSNAQDPTTLIERVYASDAVYFNDGRVDRGRSAITQRYQYMTRPGWTIQLYPRHLAWLGADAIVEVGQYQSSGIGHYVLFWQQQADGTWQARLDHNF
ncbi:MAG: hypothetical protein AAFW73_18575 [Bacteroidota bacterium]